MTVDTIAEPMGFGTQGLKNRQEARIAESLAAEEAAGRLLALKGRTIALSRRSGFSSSFSCRFRRCCSTRPSSFSSSSPASGGTGSSASAFTAGGRAMCRWRSISRCSRSCWSLRTRWAEIELPPQMSLRFGQLRLFLRAARRPRLRLPAEAGDLGRHRRARSPGSSPSPGSRRCPTRS